MLGPTSVRYSALGWPGDLNNQIFASLLTALVVEAQLRGVEMDQVKGELEGWMV